ncbi:unnamed protein product [Ectocarpus sp. 8 AP-2014]
MPPAKTADRRSCCCRCCCRSSPVLFGSSSSSCLDPLLGGLVDERLVDVRDDTAARDGGLDERVQLLVTADRELQVARRDTLHLEVLARVTGQLQHLRRQVLEDRGRVDCRRSSHALVGVHPRLEESVDTPHRELEAGLRRTRLGCLL